MSKETTALHMSPANILPKPTTDADNSSSDSSNGAIPGCTESNNVTLAPYTTTTTATSSPSPSTTSSPASTTLTDIEQRLAAVGWKLESKPTEDKSPLHSRAPNSFILYRADKAREIAMLHPNVNQSAISRMVADLWKQEPPAVKEKYRQRQLEEKKRFNERMKEKLAMLDRSVPSSSKRSNKRKAAVIGLSKTPVLSPSVRARTNTIDSATPISSHPSTNISSMPSPASTAQQSPATAANISTPSLYLPSPATSLISSSSISSSIPSAPLTAGAPSYRHNLPISHHHHHNHNSQQQQQQQPQQPSSRPYHHPVENHHHHHQQQQQHLHHNQRSATNPQPHLSHYHYQQQQQQSLNDFSWTRPSDSTAPVSTAPALFPLEFKRPSSDIQSPQNPHYHAYHQSMSRVHNITNDVDWTRRFSISSSAPNSPYERDIGGDDIAPTARATTPLVMFNDASVEPKRPSVVTEPCNSSITTTITNNNIGVSNTRSSSSRKDLPTTSIQNLLCDPLSRRQSLAIGTDITIPNPLPASLESTVNQALESANIKASQPQHVEVPNTKQPICIPCPANGTLVLTNIPQNCIIYIQPQ
ncbi:hypothetical protein EV182_002226 [Spiromyces aspiralis]|uniref:Uncharacterized protein n=1 Tax=Spiromyces aspiralis TaxID=68401 RepID=A0ACC1HSY5_9FUNG|nr:hypothetical protein EV182_002226 [Spiromyces aspiralis]